MSQLLDAVFPKILALEESLYSSVFLFVFLRFEVVLQGKWGWNEGFLLVAAILRYLVYAFLTLRHGKLGEVPYLMVTLIDRLLLQPIASLGIVLYIEWLTFPLFRIDLSLYVQPPSNIPVGEKYPMKRLFHLPASRSLFPGSGSLPLGPGSLPPGRGPAFGSRVPVSGSGSQRFLLP